MAVNVQFDKAIPNFEISEFGILSITKQRKKTQLKAGSNTETQNAAKQHRTPQSNTETHIYNTVEQFSPKRQ